MTPDPQYRWRLGGVLLFVTAATHIVGSIALGYAPDSLAIAALVGVPVLALRARRMGVATGGE